MPNKSVGLVQDDTNFRLTRRYWSLAGAVLASQLFEFFDFYIIGFVVSMIAKPWNLTFGESAIILLTTGAGAIFGSLIWGWLGDRYGRRPMLIASILTYAFGTGLSALTPVGWWWLLAIFRVIVGIGVGGGNTVAVPLVVEFTPTRHRVVMSGLATVTFIPIGGLITSIVSATLGPALGFRGLLLLGFLPVVVAIWVLWAVPESPRWLQSKGRKQEADAVVNRIFDVETGCGSAFPPEVDSGRRSGYREMLKYKKSFWTVVLLWFFADTTAIGILLWAPTLLVVVLNISPHFAATLFIGVTLAEFLGRLAFPFVANAFGRRAAGLLMGGGGAVFLTLAGILHSITFGAFSAFYIFLTAAMVFADGGWTNLVPYSSEIWPVTLRAHGAGLGNAFGGLGKMVGPAVLGLIAGSGNLITPHAVAGEVAPAFLFFAACSFALFLTFLLIAPETARSSLEEIALTVVGNAEGKVHPPH